MKFLFGCVFTLLFLAAGGYACLKLGLFPVNADTEPHWLEKKLAHMAVEAHVSHEAASLTNPLTATPEVLMAGMKMFKSDCAGCHGSPTHKDDTFAKSLYPRAPQFGHKGLDDDTRELFWITKHGIRMSGMPSFAKMIKDDDIWKIAIFIGNISKLPPAVAEEWQKP